MKRIISQVLFADLFIISLITMVYMIHIYFKVHEFIKSKKWVKYIIGMLNSHLNGSFCWATTTHKLKRKL